MVEGVDGRLVVHWQVQFLIGAGVALASQVAFYRNRRFESCMLTDLINIEAGGAHGSTPREADSARCIRRAYFDTTFGTAFNGKCRPRPRLTYRR